MKINLSLSSNITGKFLSFFKTKEWITSNGWAYTVLKSTPEEVINFFKSNGFKVEEYSRYDTTVDYKASINNKGGVLIRVAYPKYKGGPIQIEVQFTYPAFR